MPACCPVGRWPSVSQEERPQRNNLQTPLILDFQLSGSVRNLLLLCTTPSRIILSQQCMQSNTLTFYNPCKTFPFLLSSTAKLSDALQPWPWPLPPFLGIQSSLSTCHWNTFTYNVTRLFAAHHFPKSLSSPGFLWPLLLAVHFLFPTFSSAASSPLSTCHK